MASMNMGRAAVGHPVDVASGTLFSEFQDFVLPGRMQLVFARRYSSALADRPGGLFGAGWTSPFEMRIRPNLDGFCLIGEDGETEIQFDARAGGLTAGGSIRNPAAFCELRQEGGNLIVLRWEPEGREIVRYIFPMQQAHDGYVLASRQTPDGQGIDIESRWGGADYGTQASPRRPRANARLQQARPGDGSAFDNIGNELCKPKSGSATRQSPCAALQLRRRSPSCRGHRRGRQSL